MENTLQISQDDFVSYMKDIERTLSYQSDLNDLFKKYDVEGYVCRPDCVASLIHLLNKVMDIEKQDDHITKFVFESRFGKNKNSSIKYIDKSNKPRKIDSAIDLYRLIKDLSDENIEKEKDKEVENPLVNTD